MAIPSIKLCVLLVFCLPFIYSAPTSVADNLYITFISFLHQNNCKMPEEVIIPFPTAKDDPQNYLSPSLKVCQKPDSITEGKPESIICREIFDVLGSIICHTTPLHKNITVKLHGDICEAWSKVEFMGQKDEEKLLKLRLKDPLTCRMVCVKDMKHACEVLLWSYEVEKEILDSDDADQNEVKEANPEKKDENEVDEQKQTENDTEKTGETVPVPHDDEINNTEATKGPLKEIINIANKVGAIKVDEKPIKDSKKESQEPKDKKLGLEKTQIDEQSPKPDGKQLSKPEGKDKMNNIIPKKEVKKDESIGLDNKNEQKDAKTDTIAVLNSEKNEVESNSKANKEEINKASSTGDVPDKTVEKIEPPKQSETIDIDSDKKPEAVHDPKAPPENVDDDTDAHDNPEGVHEPEENEESNVNEIPDENPKPEKVADKDEVKAEEVGEKPSVDQKDIKVQNKVEEKKPEITETVPSVEGMPVGESTAGSVSSTILVPLEKMEEGNDVPPPMEKDDRFVDMENMEGDYAKYDIDQPESRVPNDISSIGKEPVPKTVEGLLPRGRGTIGHGVPDGLQEYATMQAKNEEGNFFFYFVSIVLVLMAGYVIFHNKQKIIALIVEGRHERRRRSHSAGYKKLETK